MPRVNGDWLVLFCFRPKTGTAECAAAALWIFGGDYADTVETLRTWSSNLVLALEEIGTRFLVIGCRPEGKENLPSWDDALKQRQTAGH